MKVASIAVTALLLASVSVPAFAQGAPPPPPPRHRSPGMMIAGIVLTSLASASLVAGIATIPVFSASSGGEGNIGVVVVSLPLIGGSILLAGVGIPLWVVGAKAPPAQSALIPSVSVGARSTALRWTF